MNTNQATMTLDIVGGPSRSTLFDACMYAYDPDTTIAVKFDIPRGYTAPKGHLGCAYIPLKVENLKITSILHEDGSGYSFILNGYCDTDLSIGGKNLTSHKFEAYYNAKTRKGWIRFTH